MKNTFTTKLKRINTIALKIVGIAIFLLVIFNFLYQKMPQKWQSSQERVLVRDLKSVEVSPISEKEKPKPPKLVKQVFVKQNVHTETIVIEKKDSSLTTNVPLVNAEKSKCNPTTIQASAPIAATKVETPLLLVAEEMPRFPGCEEEDVDLDAKQKCAEQKLLKYIRQNIDYPKVAMSKGIQGVVYLQFVVEKSGKIAQVKIMRDIGGECGKEAKRVVQSMPNWSPGKQGGHPTRVQFNLPVKFKL